MEANATLAPDGRTERHDAPSPSSPAADLDPSRELPGWTPRPSCRMRATSGDHVAIAPFDAGLHARGLWEALGGARTNERIRYFGWGPLASHDDLAAAIEGFETREGWSTGVFLVGGRVAGMASYMREDAASGSVEIGAIAHGHAMARSPASTEAHAMLMRHAFGLGYRRYEWKCDAANTPSMRAARRLGFTHEGTFRQHLVRQGRNRDTAWFSVLDSEWPRLDLAFAAWLSPENLTENGQARSLEAVREGVA